MANFDSAFKLTEKYEGGYANNSADKGGETYAGIARNYWPNWGGWKIIDDAKKINKAPSAINTYAKQHGINTYVYPFYKRQFWDGVKLDLIHDQQVANNLYDCAVNMGIAFAIKALQTAASVTVDGIIGPATLAAANAVDGKHLYDAINEQRKAKYNRIVANDATQQQFLKSWLSRLKPYVACLLLWVFASCATHRLTTTIPKPPKEHQIDYVGLSTFFGAAIILFTWKFKTE